MRAWNLWRHSKGLFNFCPSVSSVITDEARSRLCQSIAAFRAFATFRSRRFALSIYPMAPFVPTAWNPQMPTSAWPVPWRPGATAGGAQPSAAVPRLSQQGHAPPRQGSPEGPVRRWSCREACRAWFRTPRAEHGPPATRRLRLQFGLEAQERAICSLMFMSVSSRSGQIPRRPGSRAPRNGGPSRERRCRAEAGPVEKAYGIRRSRGSRWPLVREEHK